MQQIPEIPRQLKFRSIQTTNDRISTAILQFVTQGTEELLLKVTDICHIQFAAFYKSRNTFRKHPFVLHRDWGRVPSFQFQREGLYQISLFLKVKRLRDFEEEDWKIYYRIIDENLETNKHSPDFHQVYLKICYTSNLTNQSTEYLCNDGLPMYLPTILSNEWSKFNTLLRFRYDAEHRDGEFACKMTFLHNDTVHLDSCKMVLCLATNSIPARMDFHSIRWACKLKASATNKRKRSTTVNHAEELVYLNHPSGVIVAEISGIDLTFTPRVSSGQIRSSYEPNGFAARLAHSDVKEINGLTIGVIKASEYRQIVRMRRSDQTIHRYIPFEELSNMDDDDLQSSHTDINKRLKSYKEVCYKPLILNDEPWKKTYSQAHVRLYVAVYDQNDVLYAEILSPPLRDAKKFEQIQLIRIVRSIRQLYSDAQEFIYCTYDTDKSKSEPPISPYIVEFAFATKDDKLDPERLLKLFESQQINTLTLNVPKCSNLLQFRVPNVPIYHGYRVFIRLQHQTSLDYNPSAPAFTNDEECWIYYTNEHCINDDPVASVCKEGDKNSSKNDEGYCYLNTPPCTGL